MEISNKRCIQILKLLLKNKECMTGDNLAVAIGVSSRTIRNDMKDLNRALEDHGASVVSEIGQGYYLKIEDQEKFLAFQNEMEEHKREKDFKNIIVQIETVPDTSLSTYERGHSKALGGYYDFSLIDALRNKKLVVQLNFPSSSTSKEIDLHSQLEQVLKKSELPDGWYILNQNNDFPKEVHIDDNQIRSN